MSGGVLLFGVRMAALGTVVGFICGWIAAATVGQRASVRAAVGIGAAVTRQLVCYYSGVMRCAQCEALLEDYKAETRAYVGAADQYRLHVSRGLADLEATTRRVTEARERARRARLAYQAHMKSHRVRDIQTA